MVLERDYLDGLGGLVRLTPLTKLDHLTGQPVFYRLLGSEVALAYLKNLLTKPEKTKHYLPAGVYRDVKENLEEVIEALSQPLPEDYYPFDVNHQIHETLLHYYQTRGEEKVELPELRNRAQRYALLIENCNNGVKLAEQEEADKQDFIKMLDFFIQLEQNHQNWRQHREIYDE